MEILEEAATGQCKGAITDCLVGSVAILSNLILGGKTTPTEPCTISVRVSSPITER